MRRRSLYCLVAAVLVAASWLSSGCAGAIGSAPDEGAAQPAAPDEELQRFGALEASARALTPQAVVELPDVAEDEDHLFLIEALGQQPELRADLGGLVLTPPESWTVGQTQEGEEIRLAFLEPEGGEAVIPREAPLPEASGEVSVVWIVRYQRSNALLTEAGTSLAVHVVPVAARLEVEGLEPMVWISGEAPEGAPTTPAASE